METTRFINWDKARLVLSNSTAIIFKNTVTYFNYDPIDEDENSFNFCPDADGEKIFTFRKEDNSQIAVEGAKLWLKGETGDMFQITILEPKPIEE